MRRTLSACVLLLPLMSLTLTGCGEGQAETTVSETDAPDSTVSETSDPGSPVPGYDVTLVHQTAAGGSVEPTLTAVTDSSDLAGFLQEISPGLADLVRDAVTQGRADAGDGGDVLAAVVAVGCDVPTEVDVEPADALRDWTATAPEPSSEKECFAPVTTIAVVTVGA